MTTIRPASTDDIELINSLASGAFVPTFSEILSPEQLDYMFDMMYAPENLRKQIMELNHQYFIASIDNVPCGYVSIEPQGEQLYHLQKIYLLPEQHGTGVATELFKYALNYIDKICTHDCCTVELNVNRGNARAIRFYEKMGLYIARSGDFPIGNGFFMNDYIMAIELRKVC